MTQYEEYTQTGMLGGYKPEEIRGQELKGGKIVPFLRDMQCSFNRDKLELQREVYVNGRVFKVTSVFNLFAEKTATDSMFQLIDQDFEKNI